MKLERLGDGLYEAELEDEEGNTIRVRARVDGDLVETPYGLYHLGDLLSSSRPGGLEEEAESWLVEFDPSTGELKAKLSMKVVEASKSPGSGVEEGEKLAVVETMKMLNEVVSPCRGILVYIAEPGRGLSPGEPLARIRCVGGEG